MVWAEPMIRAAASGPPIPSTTCGERMAATPNPRVRSTTSTRLVPACAIAENSSTINNPAAAGLALDRVLREVLHEEPREAGGLVLEPQPVQQQVAGGGV